ncbi:hypothetical protein T484DRAFT_3545646 [Baffinella frigidus]|nr:hypothetical protein T484DRAFT_3545646 [Cryptophyta sp. CCMP2293]
MVFSRPAGFTLCYGLQLYLSASGMLSTLLAQPFYVSFLLNLSVLAAQPFCFGKWYLPAYRRARRRSLSSTFFFFFIRPMITASPASHGHDYCQSCFSWEAAPMRDTALSSEIEMLRVKPKHKP